MANLLNISGLLLLLVTTLLAAGAAADEVTTEWCQKYNANAMRRARVYPTDRDATQLFMDSCSLHSVNSLEFIRVPNVNTIYLSTNKISNFGPEAFSPVPTLRMLWLNENTLRELPVFAEHSCPRLNMIDLSDNQLTVIKHAETFSACAQIQKLYLSNNQIEYLHPNVFSHLPELSVLLLSNNKIRFIPRQLFERNKLVELQLQNNIITHLPPNIASHFKQTNANIHFFFHNNPWNCACLLQALADVKKAGKHILVDHYYNGRRPECKYNDMAKYPCHRIREFGAILDISSFLSTGQF